MIVNTSSAVLSAFVGMLENVDCITDTPIDKRCALRRMDRLIFFEISDCAAMVG